MKDDNFFKKEWIFILIQLIPFPIIWYFWNKFPAEVPVHWNFEGKVDDYMPKEFGLFIGPVLNIIFYFLFLAIPKLDPRKNNYKLFQGSYQTLRLGLSAFLLIITLVVLIASLGYNVDVGMIVIYATLFLFLLIGNMMGKFRHNWFVGVRTPWTLENEEIWFRTHRLAAKIWTYSTLVMIILGVIIPMTIFTILYFVYVGFISITPIVYSYVIYKKEKNIGKI